MTRTFWIAIFAAIALMFSNIVAAVESDKNTYDKNTTLKEAEAFFGESTAGLAKVIEKAFNEQGRPNGYIKGEEVSGALVVGLRYGSGTITLKNGGTRKVHWTGPSIGFDAGANPPRCLCWSTTCPPRAPSTSASRRWKAASITSRARASTTRRRRRRSYSPRSASAWACVAA